MKFQITTLVNNAASDQLLSEHGLALWIEFNGKSILFDTGQTDVIEKNAELLGADLSKADAIVLSHGHYDHSGGLRAVLEKSRDSILYVHPDAVMKRYSQQAGQVKAIGMPDESRRLISELDDRKRIVWTKAPVEIFPGVFVSGPIPRITDFEKPESRFVINTKCQMQDVFPDDQAMYIYTQQGLMVFLGCAHSGVVNTLHYIEKLSGKKEIYAVIGGMHLSNASEQRIFYTIEALKHYNVRKIGLAHCTGRNAESLFQRQLPGMCFRVLAGKWEQLVEA